MHEQLRRDEAARTEVNVALLRRLFFVICTLVFAYVLRPQILTLPRIAIPAYLLLLAVAIELLFLYLPSRQAPRPMRFSKATFVIYCAYLSFLIANTGGVRSPLILGYPILLISVVSLATSVGEVVIAGLIALASHAAGVYASSGGLGFLDDREFWVDSVLMFGVFVSVFMVTRVIAEKNLKLERSRNALEKFASGLKASNEKLERLSFTDGVTGLYNYRFFQMRLREEISRARRYNLSLAVIMADLDGFKRYNDTHGHPKGDEVLHLVGTIFKESVREMDTVTRYGGDEFGLILVDADAQTAISIANRVRERVEAATASDSYGENPEITVSSGIAVFPENGASAHELIRKADDALYKVKLSRKNSVQLYSSVMDDLKRELNGSESSTLLSTMQTLITVINARDRYTYGHSERVVKYALSIAERMGFGTDDLRTLKYAAFLHDIGKIEISRDVLNKRGPLTDEERAIIKRHTLFGVSIIEPVLSLDGILKTVLHHHERYDGQGYPGGLTGEEIPLMARVLALADSFDAMMSNRPYRDAMSLEETLQEIRRCSGAQFDPEVVRAFLAECEQPGSETVRLALGVGTGPGEAAASGE